MMYIGMLVIFIIVHYLALFDMKMISIGMAVIIGILLIGGNHSAMRTYSSMDLKNAEYDAKHINDDLSLESILKIIIPFVIYIVIIFVK